MPKEKRDHNLSDLDLCAASGLRPISSIPGTKNIAQTLPIKVLNDISIYHFALLEV
jgi:hypothetical protein